MTNEVTTTNHAQNSLEALAATGGSAWMAVTHYAALSQLATAMVRAGIAPKNMSVEQALGVMAYGLELGLGPVASLNAIAFINGRPTMYGDGISALLLRSGECTDIKEEKTGSGDDMAVTVTLARRGVTTRFMRRFSVADAKTAGLWNKAGPWTTYPERMLRWRAFGWAARDGFSDVLRGLWTREEAQDIPAVTVDAGAVTVRTAPPVVDANTAPWDVAPGPIPVVKPAPAATLTPEQTQLRTELLYLAHGDGGEARRLLAEFGQRNGGTPPRAVSEMDTDWVRATLRAVEPAYHVAMRQAEDQAVVDQRAKEGRAA
jgi:hypothetical protein